MSMPARASNTAEAQRRRRACSHYGKTSAGKWVRKRAWRACDYTEECHLKEFQSEMDFLWFEEDRYQQGASQAHYEKTLRATVPKEQLALEEAVTQAVARDGNETRVQLQGMEECLHERFDCVEREVRQLVSKVEQNMQPRPDQIQMMVELSKQNVTTLNAMLGKARIVCKGPKIEMAKCLVSSLPVHKLQALLAETSEAPSPSGSATPAPTAPHVGSTVASAVAPANSAAAAAVPAETFARSSATPAREAPAASAAPPGIPAAASAAPATNTAAAGAAPARRSKVASAAAARSVASPSAAGAERSKATVAHPRKRTAVASSDAAEPPRKCARSGCAERNGVDDPARHHGARSDAVGLRAATSSESKVISATADRCRVATYPAAGQEDVVADSARRAEVKKKAAFLSLYQKFAEAYPQSIAYYKSYVRVNLGYVLGVMLSYGSSGRVFRAQDEAGNVVAVKLFVRTGKIDRERSNKDYCDEAACLQKLAGHPHIIEIVRACHTADDSGIPGALALSYAHLGDLSGWIGDTHSRGADVSVHKCAQLYFKQLAEAIRHCHAHLIAHLDVKPDNCLIGIGNQYSALTLADFGGAWDSSCEEAPEVFGTRCWKCPEMQAGRAADIWGCGCVLFAMLDGTIPFTEWCGPDGCIVFEGRDWWEYPMPDAFPTEAKDLVHKTLQKRDSRISVADIQRHPWMLQLDVELNADTEA